ncbi:helix-turn-helix domain-containing protein [Streptomyces sp. NPDC048659]|uniref:AraC-like ligand-binding domain-containing protein n=1 Tax=Streptomyces sp. NPDC048659 TaxID=3155489 RepID=UPI003431C550
MARTTDSSDRPHLPLPTAVFSNAHLAPRDRFAHWRDLLNSTHAPMTLRSDRSDDFLARQRVIPLGDVTVWPGAFPPVDFHRTSRLIRQSDPESYHLTLMLRGSGVVVWRDRTLRTSPGVFHNNDSSRPVEIRSSAERGRVVMIGLEIPKAVLPLAPRLAERAIGLPIRDDHGVGRLLARFLMQLVRSLPEYGIADGPRLGAVAMDLTAAVLAHAVEEDGALPEQTLRRTTLLRIRSFIQQNLDDPGLSPPSIAAAHRISTSCLHRLFRHEGITVGALIRRQRLERARAELADPGMAHALIDLIAARWCLTPAGFNRSFRTAYGMRPSEYRDMVFRGRPGPHVPPERNLPLSSG